MRTPIFEDSDLEKLKDLKTKFVRAQDYESAVLFRDLEKTLMRKVDEDNQLRVKNLTEMETITKEQAKSLIELSTKSLKDTIHQLEQRLDYANNQLSNLERKALDNVNLCVEYGQHILDNCEVHTDISPDGKITRSFAQSETKYTNQDVFEQFIDQRLKDILEKKIPPFDKIEKENGEDLWKEM